MVASASGPPSGVESGDSSDNPLVINEEDLGGEDQEITEAFSGEDVCVVWVCGWV